MKPVLDADNRNTSDVYVFENENILTNILTSLIKFRRKYPSYWPSTITIAHACRLGDWDLGDIELVRSKRSLKDALFLEHFSPFQEDATVREPVKLPEKRETVEDIFHVFYRSRGVK